MVVMRKKNYQVTVIRTLVFSTTVEVSSEASLLAAHFAVALLGNILLKEVIQNWDLNGDSTISSRVEEVS